MSNQHLANIIDERDRAVRLAKAMEARVIELERELADVKQETRNLAFEFDDLAADNRRLEDKLKIAELAHDQRLSEIDSLNERLAKYDAHGVDALVASGVRIFRPDADDDSTGCAAS